MSSVYKKGALLLGLLVSCQLAAPARSPRAASQTTPASAAEQQAAAYTQRLAAEVGLTPEQLPRVRQIVLTSRLEMAAISQRAHQSGDPAAVRPAMKAARDKADLALRGVLTPAQFAKYQQYVAARIGQLRTTSQTD